MERRKKRGLSCACLLVLAGMILTGCGRQPLRIGVIGSLSAKQSQLSIDARNAIELGVAQVNESGGIDGRPLELVVKDDQGSTAVALKRQEEFLQEEVHLILGHMTSNMTEAVLAGRDQPLLFLSPSMSHDALTGFDDNFIRTCPQAAAQGDAFMAFAGRQAYGRIVVAYDRMNAAYTETVAQRIEALSLLAGMPEVDLVPFDSQSDDLTEVAAAIRGIEKDVVLFISQATDTAFLAQKLRQAGDPAAFCSVSWSMTQDLIRFGGKAVDGMHFIGLQASTEPSEALQDFQAAFTERYDYAPSFMAMMAYDTFQVLLRGLEEAESFAPEDVKRAILSGRTYQGLEEDFRLDEFGDSSKGYMIYKLQDGVFNIVD